MQACSVCKTILLSASLREGDRVFCSALCFSKGSGRFCKECLSKCRPPTEASRFSLPSGWKRGWPLFSSWCLYSPHLSARCERCHAISFSRWVGIKLNGIGWVPFFPIGRWLIVNNGRSIYGRQLGAAPKDEGKSRKHSGRK